MGLARYGLLSCVVLSLAAGAAWAETQTFLLAGFEPNGPNMVAGDGKPVKEHATEGEYALKVDNTGEGYTGFRITDKAALARFKDFVLLKVDIFNPQDVPIRFGVRVDDPKSTSYGTRFNDDNFVAPPGKFTMELNLTGLTRSNSKNFDQRDALDVAQLTLVAVTMGPQKPPVVLYFDNIRLETTGLPKVEGLRAFDFGPAKSGVYPGFEAVTEKMPYDKQRGFGFLGTVQARRVYTPDDLASDFLRGDGFQVDLPNGAYDLNLCIDPFGEWHAPYYWQWRKMTINGKEVLNEKMTGEEFLDKVYFRHEDDEDLPGQDVWDKYIVPVNRIRQYTAEVTDGKLQIRLDSDSPKGKTLLFLVVYPAAKNAEGRAFMAELDKQRRERFKNNLQVWVPKNTNPAPKPTDDDTKRGFISFVRHSEIDIPVNACPAPEEIGKGITLEAARGQREAVQIGLYPLAEVKNVAVQVSPLVTPNGGMIAPTAVTVHKVRNFLKHEGRARAGTILPYILQGFDRLDLAPGVTRGLWVTVSVPEGAVPGVYNGSIRIGTRLASFNVPSNANIPPNAVIVRSSVAVGANAVVIPVKLTVHPFKLDKVTDITMSVTGARPAHWRTWFPDLEEKYWKLAEAVCKDYADHGMNAITGGPGAKFTGMKDGRPVIDYSDMDRWLDLAVKAGLTMPGDSYQGLGVEGLPINTGKNAVADSDKAAREKFGMSFEELIRAVYADVAAHAKEKGWMPRLHYFLDEPRLDFGNVEACRDLIAVMVKASPETMFSGYYSTGDGRDVYFQTMPVSIAHMNRIALKLTKDAGKSLWEYDGHRVRYNIGRYAFVAARQGLKGYLRNGYMYVNSDPYFDFSDDEASWCVVYPSRSGVNASVGWERTGEGVDDYRCLAMCERLIKKARAGNKAAAEADAAEAYLKETLKGIEIPEGKPGEPDTRVTAKLTPEGYDLMRHTLAEHISALVKAVGE